MAHKTDSEDLGGDEGKHDRLKTTLEHMESQLRRLQLERTEAEASVCDQKHQAESMKEQVETYQAKLNKQKEEMQAMKKEMESLKRKEKREKKKEHDLMSSDTSEEDVSFRARKKKHPQGGAKSKQPYSTHPAKAFKTAPVQMDDEGNPILTPKPGKPKFNLGGEGGSDSSGEEGDEDSDSGKRGRAKKDPTNYVMNMMLNAINSMAGPKIPSPVFTGKAGQNPASHLLRATDWMEQHNIKKRDRVVFFKHTLDGKARCWYDNLEGSEEITWEELKQEFSKHYSPQGRTPKQLCDKWDSLDFNPEVDDIDTFISEVKSTAKQLQLPETSMLIKIKGKMPKELGWSISHMKDLDLVIKTVTDVFGKTHDASGKDKLAHLQVKQGESLKAMSTANSDRMTSLEDAVNKIANSISSLGKLPPTAGGTYPPKAGNGGGPTRGRGRPQPFKPYPIPPKRGRGRGGGGNRGRGRGQDSPSRGGRGNSQTPRGGYDRSPSVRKPKVASKPVDRDGTRCHNCHQFGHWKRECPNRGNEDEDDDASPSPQSFNGLQEGLEEEYVEADYLHLNF